MAKDLEQVLTDTLRNLVVYWNEEKPPHNRRSGTINQVVDGRVIVTTTLNHQKISVPMHQVELAGYVNISLELKWAGMKDHKTPPESWLQSKDVTPLDAFAAYAMNGLLSSSEDTLSQDLVANAKTGNMKAIEHICDVSYDIAEAMIAERQKRINKQNQK